MALHGHAFIRILCTMTNSSPPGAVRAGIVGASGYTGVELLRLLAGHPVLEVVTVTADSNAGVAVTELYPSLTGAYDGVAFAALDDAPLDGLDVVFLGLPHGESQKLVPSLLGRVGHVVDLAADFRLPADTYEQWYGEPHTAPELLDQFAFGMVELFRDDLAAAAHVAAPGCYPTASSLALGAVPRRRARRAHRHRRERGVGHLGGRAQARRPPTWPPSAARTSSATGSSTTATPARSSTHSPTWPGSRCRCCSRPTSCR